MAGEYSGQVIDAWSDLMDAGLPERAVKALLVLADELHLGQRVTPCAMARLMKPCRSRSTAQRALADLADWGLARVVSTAHRGRLTTYELITLDLATGSLQLDRVRAPVPGKGATMVTPNPVDNSVEDPGKGPTQVGPNDPVDNSGKGSHQDANGSHSIFNGSHPGGPLPVGSRDSRGARARRGAPARGPAREGSRSPPPPRIPRRKRDRDPVRRQLPLVASVNDTGTAHHRGAPAVDPMTLDPEQARCPEHQGWPREEVPHCGPCGGARRAAEGAQDQARADEVLDEEHRLAAVAACGQRNGWCDRDGWLRAPGHRYPFQTDLRSRTVRCDHHTRPWDQVAAADREDQQWREQLSRNRPRPDTGHGPRRADPAPPAKTVPCPDCDVAAGAQCRNEHGGVTSTHAARRAAAASQQAAS